VNPEKDPDARHIVVAALIVIAAVLITRQRTSKHLKQPFGPEYGAPCFIAMSERSCLRRIASHMYRRSFAIRSAMC
jgi:hypothetical protein